MRLLLFLPGRLLGLASVLLAMTLIVFTLQSLVPNDPARALAGPNATREAVDRLRERMGLDDPVPVQYLRYLGGLMKGDLGTSVRTRKPVVEDLAKYAPASVELMLAALVIGVAAGAGIGLARGRGRAGRLLRVTLLLLGSAPIFLTGLLLAFAFWFRLDWLPGAGRMTVRGVTPGPTGLWVIDGALAGRWDVVGNALSHLVLPATTLAIPIAVAVARTLQSALHAEMTRAYVRTARAKGLGEGRILLWHVLRNALPAPLTMVGLQVGLLFANILVVERIFAWPGLGLYATQSFDSSDLPAVLGVALVLGVVYITVNTIIDLILGWADPRVGPG
jgi:peptide/nickel transport system permease protein/dipeptide transport system permease protein